VCQSPNQQAISCPDPVRNEGTGMGFNPVPKIIPHSDGSPIGIFMQWHYYIPKGVIRSPPDVGSRAVGAPGRFVSPRVKLLKGSNVKCCVNV